MDIKDIGVFIGAGVAVLGWVVARYQTIQLTKRKEQLELVNKRLDDFYGPLYVATRAGQAAYESVLAYLGISEGIIFGGTRPLSEEELKEWHHWMKHVLIPLNNVIEKTILENAYLIIEEKMPSPLIEYMNHISTTRAIFAHWDTGDYTLRYLPIKYPIELDEYIAISYSELKKDQLRLIGLTTK